MKPGGTRRERGAYYTPANVALQLAEWGIRARTDSVLDPSAGLGALLEAAATRLSVLRRRSGAKIYGVELHRSSHRKLQLLGSRLGIPASNILHGDFFGVSALLPKVDVVLMNPPYVRHQDIPVGVCRRMRRRVGEHGIQLSGRASSWAYFVIESCRQLKVDGRLAAVLPQDLLDAVYGRQVLDFLRRRFASVDLVPHGRDMFPGLQLRVALVYCEGYAAEADRNALLSLRTDFGQSGIVSAITLPTRAEACRPPRRHGEAGARSLLAEIERLPGVRTLESVATVNIGYVTGGSDFFHITEAERRELELEEPDVVPAITRGRQASGLVHRFEDWAAALSYGDACWLLRPRELSVSLAAYLATRRAAEVSRRAKCRTRSPWWRVKCGARPAAFFVYSGGRQRIVANNSGCWGSNALYTITLNQEFSAADLAVASLTSVGQLGVAVAGRELGGGLRKLDVGDAKRLKLPGARLPKHAVSQIDLMVRAGSWKAAIGRADELVLRDALGWPMREIVRLQEVLFAINRPLLDVAARHGHDDRDAARRIA